MLTAHQTLAIRRAFPGAHIDGTLIRIGIWRMHFFDGDITMPFALRPDPHFDGSDEALEVWTRLREVLGC